MASIDSVAGYRAAAGTRLDAQTWQYLEGGEDGPDAAAFAARPIMPRPLRELRGGHTRLELFGQQLEHPILLAPVAYQRLFHADGECASVMAATAQGGQAVVSSLASQPFADIVAAGRQPDGAEPWFQLYWQGDRQRSLHLLQRAVAAGCSVVVFTVDAPVKLATLQLPDGVTAVNLEPAVAPAPISSGSVVFDGWMALAPTWDDIAWLRAQTNLPLLLKGILHPDDGERALDLGCDGLVVSTHGGRVLKRAPAALDVLPAIAQRVAGRAPILFDSGIRSGSDVFVALALGATAVLVGRPYIWGLAADSAMGVAHVIRLLRDELEMTMALAGCARPADIGLHCLAAR
jgi:4-hydroxymandelate oxidase